MEKSYTKESLWQLRREQKKRKEEIGKREKLKDEKRVHDSEWIYREENEEQGENMVKEKEGKKEFMTAYEEKEKSRRKKRNEEIGKWEKL